jgi:hypothetical protein
MEEPRAKASSSPPRCGGAGTGKVDPGQQHHQCVRELLVLFVPCRLVAVLSAVQAGRDEHRRTSARHNTGRGGGLEEDHTGQGIAWAAADGCMVACTVRQAAGCTAHGLVDPLRAGVSSVVFGRFLAFCRQINDVNVPCCSVFLVISSSRACSLLLPCWSSVPQLVTRSNRPG